MEITKIVPQWMLSVLQVLHSERDRLKAIVDEKEAAHEAARRACIVPQQLLTHVNDAIRALGHAAEWSGGTREEIPY